MAYGDKIETKQHRVYSSFDIVIRCREFSDFTVLVSNKVLTKTIIG